MTRARAMVAALAALGLAACGGPAPGGSTTPDADGPRPAQADASQATPGDTTEPPTAFVEASASAATEREARERAIEALRERVLGDAAGTSVTVHQADRDPRRVEETDDGVTVWLGLSEERVREILEAVVATPAPSLPAPFEAPVSTLHRAALAGAVCERRRELFDAECEPPDVASLARQVRELATRVRLRPGYEGGVPVDSDGHPMRAATVVVERVHPDGDVRPVPGIPVVARTERRGPPVAHAFSDEQGRASLAVEMDEALSEPLVVEIDREALLGPVARHWPERDVRLSARPRDLRRWTGVARERVSGSPSDEHAFVDGLLAAMRSHGARSPMPLEDDERERLLSTQRARRGEVFPELADAWEGRVDYVLLGDVQSEFASRMGHSRVWFEARGTLEAVDVWTGRTVATVEASVTEPGLGDERAARAAHRSLAERLVERLLEELGEEDRVARAGETRR